LFDFENLKTYALHCLILKTYLQGSSG